jgi:hypothetical protein
MPYSKRILFALRHQWKCYCTRQKALQSIHLLPSLTISRSTLFPQWDKVRWHYSSSIRADVKTALAGLDAKPMLRVEILGVDN